MKKSQLWIDDPVAVLFGPDLLKIWPFETESYVDKVNAFTRFVLYYGALLSAMRNQREPLLVALACIVGVVFLVKLRTPKNPNAPTRNNPPPPVADYCPAVTTNNPLANPVFGESTVVDTCNLNHDDPPTAREVQRSFENGLPMNEWDVYGKNNSQRQYFTMAPNDQTAFANWLYSPDVFTCNKSQRACGSVLNSSMFAN
jgi:hypothetical protein